MAKVSPESKQTSTFGSMSKNTVCPAHQFRALSNDDKPQISPNVDKSAQMDAGAITYFGRAASHLLIQEGKPDE
jgi:hypothetical protein